MEKSYILKITVIKGGEMTPFMVKYKFKLGA